MARKTKAVAYFRTIGKYRHHTMGSQTKYVPIAGPSGPEFQQVSLPKAKIKHTPTPVFDETVAERIRAEKYYGTAFIECDRGGKPLGKVEPTPQSTTTTANDVRTANDALGYFASHIEGFDPETMLDVRGNLSYPKIKSLADEKGVEFPNYGKE